MKKTYITVIVLVLVVLGGLFFLNKAGKEESVNYNTSAPVLNEKQAFAPDVKNTKEFTVSGQNFSFTPKAITVKKGDRVKITFNNADGFHDFKIDEFGVATKQSKSPYQEVLEFTADKSGSFEYYCSVGSHRAMGMRGTFKVE